MVFDLKPNNPCPIRIRPGIIAIAILLLLVSCTHHQEQRVPDKDNLDRAHGPRNPSEIEKQLAAEYTRWQGTRHRLGGSSRNGVDCSGFVKAVYKNIFEMDLPRTTRAQSTLGRSVDQTDLQAGDLVFFKPPSYPRHVGIYLSRSEFIHASKSNGVTISRIDPVYWGNYFWMARRLLPDAPHR